jgi:uncharacterized protein YggE
MYNKDGYTMKRFLIILAVFGLFALTAGAAYAQDSTVNPTITVSGVGSASGEPDIAYVQVGAERTDRDLGAAFNATATTMRAVFDALTTLGIAPEDIQTTSLNVYPQDRYGNDGQIIERQFQVSNVIQVTVRDITQIEAVVTTAVAQGANTVYNLSFGIDDSAALEQEARQAAVADARARAEQLAEALGVTVGRPLTVTEVVSSGSPVLPFAGGGMAMAAMDSVRSQPISGGQLSVSVSVQITFALE